MTMDHPKERIYTPQVLEFAALGVEFASLMERGGELHIYVETCLRVLPRLYSQVLALPDYLYDEDTDLIEEYITEQAYERVRHRAEHTLGEHDLYLTTASPEMAYSDTPLAMHLSEQLADIYQHVGNLLGILREENTEALPAAIGRCRLYWREHWGLALLSALPALHQLHLTLEDQTPNLDEDEYPISDLDDLLDED